MLKQTTDSALAVHVEKFSSMSTEELKDELKRHWEVGVDRIIRVSAIIRILEDRGEDLSDVRNGMLHYFRKVAFAQLLPAVIEKFVGQPLLLNRAAAMPISDQERLIADSPLKLMSIENGKTDHRMVEPTKLRAAEIRQIFARDHLRDEGEQVSWLREKRVASRVASSEVEVDTKRKELVVGGVRITLSELITYLARITG